MAADVGRHDDDGVLEIDCAALTIGQPAIVENLQQHVEHIVVRFFDFVEQDHGIRPPPHGFGQLAAFFEADVPGRRANEPGHRVLLLILGHVDADHRVLVVKQELGESPGQFGFSDARGSEKDEAADRAVRIFQPGAGANDGFGDGRHRFILADDALVQFVFEMQQFLNFAFEQLAKPGFRSSG